MLVLLPSDLAVFLKRQGLSFARFIDQYYFDTQPNPSLPFEAVCTESLGEQRLIETRISTIEGSPILRGHGWW